MNASSERTIFTPIELKKPSRRRHEPDRRDRLIDVALELITQHGIVGASHRAVAEAAEVPLGSTTYHFSTLDELHAEAIRRHANKVITSFRDRLAPATTRDATIEALVRLVMDELIPDRAALVITIELYSLAVRKPVFRQIVDEWVQITREILELHMDAESARAVNAMIEGVQLHGGLSNTTFSRHQVRRDLSGLISR